MNLPHHNSAAKHNNTDTLSKSDNLTHGSKQHLGMSVLFVATQKSALIVRDTRSPENDYGLSASTRKP